MGQMKCILCLRIGTREFTIMKKICIALFALASYFSSSAQVADGTTVPDFTFKDINGNTQNLYTYLNQNKYVVIDASATWCGPCWNFHHTAKTLEHLYTDRDVVGDNTARVLDILFN